MVVVVVAVVAVATVVAVVVVFEEVEIMLMMVVLVVAVVVAVSVHGHKTYNILHHFVEHMSTTIQDSPDIHRRLGYPRHLNIHSIRCPTHQH